MHRGFEHTERIVHEAADAGLQVVEVRVSLECVILLLSVRIGNPNGIARRI